MSGNFTCVVISLALAASSLQRLAAAHISNCHVSRKCLFFMSWIFFQKSRTLEIVRSASATSTFRISSCKSALRNFRNQATFSFAAKFALSHGLILFRLNLLRVFSTHCRDLSDSAYSNSSAVQFYEKHLLSVGWIKLFHNFIGNRISNAAVLYHILLHAN